MEVELYPPEYEHYKVEDVQITWQVDANGYTIYDVDSNELGCIAIEEAEDLQPMVHGDLLGFWSEKNGIIVGFTGLLVSGKNRKGN